MAYSLTDGQKALATWLVGAVRENTISEEFMVNWFQEEGAILQAAGAHPEITKGVLDALETAGLLISGANTEIKTTTTGRKNPKLRQRERETSRRCTLTGKAFEAVDSGFDAPDESFVKHLSPLADVTNLDPELKKRCLPTLGAGSDDPMLWDTAVRTAVVILEERIRTVAGIGDSSRTGIALVNAAFADKGTMAAAFERDAERQSYRDLYAGVVGVFRNRYAHRLVDPTPEDGGTLIVFVNLLLKMIDDLEHAVEDR